MRLQLIKYSTLYLLSGRAVSISYSFLTGLRIRQSFSLGQTYLSLAAMISFLERFLGTEKIYGWRSGQHKRRFLTWMSGCWRLGKGHFFQGVWKGLFMTCKKAILGILLLRAKSLEKYGNLHVLIALFLIWFLHNSLWLIFRWNSYVWKCIFLPEKNPSPKCTAHVCMNGLATLYKLRKSAYLW